MTKSLDYPLMDNNILREDLDAVIAFLQNGTPRLTQDMKVREFEQKWSEWVGIKHSLFVNSGASANLATIAALKHLYGAGEIIVPPLTWVSDISSVIWNGFTPVFADINPKTLGMADNYIMEKLTDKTRAVFLTYVLGFNCLTDRLLNELKKRNIVLIEDVCESHGAKFRGKRLGGFGLASNFSFYYAHHMSTIEGGIICTNDDSFYDIVKMLRSHGMVREAYLDNTKQRYKEEFPEVHPEFTFAFPAFNIRSTEINAVIGINQISRLDDNIEKRNQNFSLFLENLDNKKYYTDFDCEGMSNYAFILVLREPEEKLWEKVCDALRENSVEFRQGTAGGGNMLRQPYLRGFVGESAYKQYANTEHIHQYGLYLGNYPTLEKKKILSVCKLLNDVR
jgi:CDP-6-deoxy-D-xylo-4-hexulose-3-dehydrase